MDLDNFPKSNNSLLFYQQWAAKLPAREVRGVEILFFKKAPFVPNAAFLYPMKTFCCFSGDRERLHWENKG